MNTIHIIVGPTASGKSEAAHRLADYFNAPIINADAYQIYKDMDIGTNKISPLDPYYKKYSLLDIISPQESFSIAEYQKMFRNEVSALFKKYNNIVVVGGSGLYIRAAIYDYVFNDEESMDMSEYNDKTNGELHEILAKIDPKSAEIIHENNRKRVLRAIQIFKENNMSKTEINERQSHQLIYPKENVKIYFINPERNKLYALINDRVEKMFVSGLIDECKYLEEKYHLSSTSKVAIGYKEVYEFLNGKISLEECKELIKKNTRNYAKRQVTFFKHQFESVEYSSSAELVKEICK